MSHRTWLTIPTYWGAPGSAGDSAVDFDHPSSLDGVGTLGRTLASVGRLRGDFALLLLVGVTHQRYAAAAQRKVIGLARGSARPTYVVSPTNLEALNRHLPLAQGLGSYGQIRNTQLLLPFAAGAQVVAALDDDETLPDRGHLAAVRAGLARPGVVGLAGPYLNPDGTHRVLGLERARLQGRSDNLFVRKLLLMDRTLDRLMATPGPRPSAFACGGNMAFSRRLVRRVCFDPWIPRGEDFDYLLNAATAGLTFHFQRELPIIHDPPQVGDGSGAQETRAKLVADIRRFLYMKQKATHHRKSSGSDAPLLDPRSYPGAFVAASRRRLLGDAAEALALATPGLAPADARREVAAAWDEVGAWVPRFLAYRARWQEATRQLEGSPLPARVLEPLRVCGGDPARPQRTSQ